MADALLHNSDLRSRILPGQWPSQSWGLTNPEQIDRPELKFTPFTPGIARTASSRVFSTACAKAIFSSIIRINLFGR